MYKLCNQHWLYWHKYKSDKKSSATDSSTSASKADQVLVEDPLFASHLNVQYWTIELYQMVEIKDAESEQKAND